MHCNDFLEIEWDNVDVDSIFVKGEAMSSRKHIEYKH